MVERPTLKSSASSSVVLADACQGDQVCFLAGRELGLLASEPVFGLRDGHAFAGPSTDQVGLELGHHRQNIEKQPADGIGRVVNGGAELEANTAGDQFGNDVSRVRHRAGKPVELGHDKGVARPARG